MDTHAHTALVDRVRALEKHYASTVLPFYRPAKDILEVLISTGTYKTLLPTLNDVNFRSVSFEHRTSLDHVQEKLERCEFRCECEFIDACRNVVNMLMTHIERDLIYWPATKQLEHEMEILFVKRLQRPMLHDFVESQLNGGHSGNDQEPVLSEDLQQTLREYAPSAENGEQVKVHELSQGAMIAFCKKFPKQHPTWRRAMSHQAQPEVTHAKRGDQDEEDDDYGDDADDVGDHNADGDDEDDDDAMATTMQQNKHTTTIEVDDPSDIDVDENELGDDDGEHEGIAEGREEWDNDNASDGEGGDDDAIFEE